MTFTQAKREKWCLFISVRLVLAVSLLVDTFTPLPTVCTIVSTNKPHSQALGNIPTLFSYQIIEMFAV